MTAAAQNLREGLAGITELAILVIDAMALVLVLVASLHAFVSSARLLFSPAASRAARRDVWLRYGRVLVAALTFQLAADIIETSITTDWEAVARLAAVAVIRTFLNYFLERDLTELRGRSRPAAVTGPERPG